MVETAWSQFWRLVGGAIALQPEAFRRIEDLPNGTIFAVWILLLAGLSVVLSQAIVLFVNRVKPLRFVLTLAIGALLYGFAEVFWMLSTWLVSRLLYQTDVLPLTVFRSLGLAHAPLLFSFLVAIPFLGVPLNVLLSLWSLLAFVVGFRAVTTLVAWQTFVCAALGWAVLQILQRTIGKPMQTLGHLLANSVAGVPLVTDLQGIEQLLERGVERLSRRSRPPMRR